MKRILLACLLALPAFSDKQTSSKRFMLVPHRTLIAGHLVAANQSPQ